MDYFNDVFTTFLGLEHCSSVAVYAGSESSQKAIFSLFNLYRKEFKMYQFIKDLCYKMQT